MSSENSESNNSSRRSVKSSKSKRSNESKSPLLMNEECEENSAENIPKIISMASLKSEEDQVMNASQAKITKELQRVREKKKEHIFADDIMKIYQNIDSQKKIDPQSKSETIHDENQGSHKRAMTMNQKSKKPTPKSQKSANLYDNLSEQNKQLYNGYVKEYRNLLQSADSECNSKKQSMVKFEFFKILMIGVFELRSLFNDQEERPFLSKKQQDVAEPKTDVFTWIEIVCASFEKEFRKAEDGEQEGKGKVKGFNALKKWETLVKNCKDHTNSQLRRHLISRFIKPMAVIEKADDFLLSKQTRNQLKRREMLLLAEAGKNFERLSEQEENSQSERVASNDTTPNQTQDKLGLNKASSAHISEENNNPYSPDKPRVSKLLVQEMEKIKEYRNLIESNEFILKMKRRIETDLKGNDSYDRIMVDFKQKFHRIIGNDGMKMETG